MDPKKLTTLIVGTVVLVIMFSALLVPIVSDGQKTTNTTITNDVSALTYKLDGDDDYTFESAPAYYNYKVNGQLLGNTSAVGQFITTDKCRANNSGHWFQLFDETGTRSSNVDAANQNIKVTYTAATKTLVYTVYTDLTNTEIANEYTYVVENILYVTQNGDYGAINTGGDPDVSYYVNDLSQVIAGGAYTTGELDTSYFAEGSTVYVGNTSYTATGTATTEAYKNYTDVIAGSSYSVTVTDGTNSETFTPYTVFVPIKVIAHTPTDNIVIQLIGVLPIITILGIVLAVVGVAIVGRNDY